MTTLLRQGCLQSPASENPGLPRRSRFSLLPRGKNRSRRVIAILFSAFIVLLFTAALLLAHYSFRPSAVVQDLEESTGTKLKFQVFRQTYFPHPGCVLEGLSFVPGRAPQASPVMTIQKLTIVGSYLRLFAHHVPLMRAEGMHVVFPPLGSNVFSQRTKSKIVIGQFLTDGAVVEFTPRNPQEARLRFLVHHFVIHGLASGRAMRFESALSNPKPPGEITVAGSIGPWNDESPEESRAEGSYTFQGAQLGSFEGIAGVLSSHGKFYGTFKQLAVEGNTDTPAFEVKRSEHPTHLITRFRALVDATNGDVTLEQVNANFWKTTLLARGTVQSTREGSGKTARIEFVGHEGRIEDLMMLFIREKKAPFAGVISFGASTLLPPGDVPFLKKIQLEGDFGIGAAHFTNPVREQQVTELSERARGQGDKVDDGDLPPERVLSDLRGHVLLRHGRARFSHLTFTVPGATAQMQGTYDLISERINLHGTLHMLAKPSEATSGVKSFLLKVLNPFTKKDKRNRPISFSITGTYDKPEYSVSP